ncbi:hypothetical protein A2130_03405 [Candidatus Woesebacteria bacterium GWC2_33_12]|nr:MAG: hypothetical protein A2130_03405 [Candidatus Woesebacteria bacterium GWC2_33_12]HCR36191.1 hypothetical protein [Candidatus Woesebacteria bacterium]
MSKFKIISIALVVLIFAGVAGGGYYFFNKYQETKKILENPEEAAKIETQKIVEKVGKLMELPSGEPTIATVLDKEKLKDQAFFLKSENGDKVIIYAESKTAILYRPSTNKIIGFAPINLGEPKDQEPVPTEAPVSD